MPEHQHPWALAQARVVITDWQDESTFADDI